jgi:hypothetical protein
MTLYSKFLFSLLLGLSLPFFATAQATQERLVIESETYQYSLVAPKGWDSDMENATDIMCDVAFFPVSFSLETAVDSGEPIIQVAAFEKKDENTIEDLNFDLEQYKKEYTGVKIASFEAKHPSFKSYSKVASLEGVFYQYLTYINAGKDFSNAISVAMNTAEHPATEAQLAAFQAVVASLKMK